MANYRLTRYRLYKFIMNDDVKDYILQNYSLNTGWSFYSGLLWSDRNEEEYRLRDFTLFNDNGSFKFKITENFYAVSISGTPVFQYSSQYTLGASSGTFYTDFVPFDVDGHGSPVDYGLIPDTLYELSCECYDIIETTSLSNIDSIHYTYTNMEPYDNVDKDRPVVTIVLNADSDYIFYDNGNQLFDVDIKIEYIDDMYGNFITATFNGLTNSTITISKENSGKRLRIIIPIYALYDVEHDQRTLKGIKGITIPSLDKCLVKENVSVTSSLVGVTESNSASTTPSLSAYSNSLTVNPNYYWKSIVPKDVVQLKMGGMDVTEQYVRYRITPSPHMQISIPYVTGDIEIIATATMESTLYIYDQDGTNLLTSIRGKYFSNFKVVQNANTVTLSLYTGISSATYNLPITIPDGYEFVGMAWEPNSKTVNFLKDITYSTVFGSSDLYYVVKKIETIPTTFTLDLYHNNSPKNTVTKDLVSLGSISGTLRESCDVLYPVIKIELANEIVFDYVYIPQFKRYYYVESIKVILNNLYEVSLSIDVLNTYDSLIRLQQAQIIRCNTDSTSYKPCDIIDEMVTCDYEKDIVVNEITPLINIFDEYGSDGWYVLGTVDCVEWNLEPKGI